MDSFRRRELSAQAPWSSARPLRERLDTWEGDSGADLDLRGLKFAPGALDGIGTHHGGIRGRKHADIGRVVDRLVALVRDDTDARRRDLYSAMIQHLRPEDVDALLQRVSARGLDRPALRARALWLLDVGAHATPVKVGLALLGIAGEQRDVETLLTFARHDEFTLYASVAATNLLPDPVDASWAIAKSAEGWGRIQAVERLAQQMSARPDVKDWLIREGYKNSVMDEYLALICARSGDLARALEPERVDLELLESTCRLTSALLAEGPTPGISEYADGKRVVERLLEHVAAHPGSSLELLSFLVDTRVWLAWPQPAPLPPSFASALSAANLAEIDRSREASWTKRAGLGWSEETRARIADRCDAILSAPEWRRLVDETLRRGDDASARRAFRFAAFVGTDPWETGFARLSSDPEAGFWFEPLLRSTVDASRIDRVVRFAEEHLPLAEIATGPADELGLGVAFRAHQSLDWVVQEMNRPQVWSSRLLVTALRSPVVRNRNMAVRALKSHPRSEWGAEVEEAIARGTHDDTDPKIRAALEDLAG